MSVPHRVGLHLDSIQHVANNRVQLAVSQALVNHNKAMRRLQRNGRCKMDLIQLQFDFQRLEDISARRTDPSATVYNGLAQFVNQQQRTASQHQARSNYVNPRQSTRTEDAVHTVRCC